MYLSVLIILFSDWHVQYWSDWSRRIEICAHRAWPRGVRRRLVPRTRTRARGSNRWRQAHLPMQKVRECSLSKLRDCVWLCDVMYSVQIFNPRRYISNVDVIVHVTRYFVLAAGWIRTKATRRRSEHSSWTEQNPLKVGPLTINKWQNTWRWTLILTDLLQNCHGLCLFTGKKDDEKKADNDKE